MRKSILVLIGFLFSVSNLFAGDITFTVSAPDAVVVGQQFRLSYTVTTQKIKDFRMSPIKGFEVLMGPEVSRHSETSMNLVGGKATTTTISSLVYTYTLLATAEGSFSIPSATIVANGEQMRSNSVTIKVLPQDRTEERSSATSVSNQDLFVTATASKTTVYEQEAFFAHIQTIYISRCEFRQCEAPRFQRFPLSRS